MMNIMVINGFKATIHFDPETNLFRGEFLGLNGGADFYAKDIDGLQKEGKISLNVFLDMCKEEGVEPRKEYSGKFNVRVPKALHEELTHIAAAQGKSLNQFIVEVLDESIHTHQ